MLTRLKHRQLAAASLSCAAGVAAALQLPWAQAASPFNTRPVEAKQAITLAQPLSGNRWNLVVLEQLKPAPPCWRRFPDGRITTYETTVPQGTCGVHTSSSAYSLRAGGDDLRHPWRLRIENSNGQLQLLASGSLQAEPLLIGSGSAMGSGPVELQLSEGWSLERRLYQGKALNHLYVAHADPLPALLARAKQGNAPLLAGMPLPPPPPPTPGKASPTPSSSGSSRLARLESLRLGRVTKARASADGVIALKVVPYRP